MRNRYSSKKKLGVLVSSLALVAVTALAGVTGTAAWFTATRRVQSNVSEFTAFDPNGSLSITATRGQGTFEVAATKTGDPVTDITTTVNGKKNYLRDASVNMNDLSVYSASMDDNTVAGFNKVNADDDIISGNLLNTQITASGDNAGNVYYAFTWKYTFKLAKPGVNGSALFFDLTSEFKDTASKTISDGFRIGLKTTAGSAASTTDSPDNPWLVFGNNSTVNDTTKANYYVNGTGADSTSTYVATSGTTQKYFTHTNDSRYLDQELTLSDAKENKSVNSHRSVYLGKFTSANVTGGITVTAIAWFEGNDSSVISGNVDAAEALSAKLKFYARDLKASA